MDAILCAVDGSDRASEAFERALEIAEVTRADLHLIQRGSPGLQAGRESRKPVGAINTFLSTNSHAFI